ncbi:hypothetical protein KI387_002930, partial [Taxus chinensis]
MKRRKIVSDSFDMDRSWRMHYCLGVESGKKRITSCFSDEIYQDNAREVLDDGLHTNCYTMDKVD